jgi:hypothetical protein
MTAWLTSLRDRPIAESERAAAMATVTMLLLAAALLLALSRPSNRPRPTLLRHPGPSVAQRTPIRPAQAPESDTAQLTPLVARAADLFLAGYLSYTYGHARTSAIGGATPALLESLRSSPPRVSPGMRVRRPHVVALRSTPASSGPLRVSAVINDGGLVDYSIGLLLVAHGDRLLVSGLEGGE